MTQFQFAVELFDDAGNLNRANTKYTTWIAALEVYLSYKLSVNVDDLRHDFHKMYRDGMTVVQAYDKVCEDVGSGN